MAHRTDPTDLDEALARILSEPTWARQIITATACHLQTEDPFLTLTETDLTATLDMVTELITGHLPQVVADEAAERAAAVLPPLHPRETCDTYALRLLHAARSL
jgi:hypothetical protein